MKLLHEITVPQEIVNDETVIVASLNRRDGDHVEAGEQVAEIETSKTAVNLDAPGEGYIRYLCSEGDEIPIGATVAQLYDEPGESPASEAPAEPDEDASGEKTPVRFSKAARALIKELGLDPAAFAQHDLVDTADVAALARPAAPVAPVAPVAAPPAKLPPESDFQAHFAEKLAEIRYLSHVQSAGLTSLIGAHVRVDGLLPFISQALPGTQSPLPVIVYEAGRLLRQFPALNSAFHQDGIAVYQHVHVGIAIDMDKGLRVGKVADADTLDVRQIQERILQLADRYLDDELTLDDLSGTTFTITDLSADGASFFVPLINSRQAAILGVSAVDPKLQRITLTLAFDHRVTEGRTAARFLAQLRERLETYRASEPPPLQCAYCLKTLAEDKAMRGPGLLPVIDHRGEQVLICHACFHGD